MKHLKLKNRILKFLSLCLVFGFILSSIPSELIFATSSDDSITSASLGVSVPDYVINSNDYSFIHDYGDLVVAGLWESLGEVYNSQGYPLRLFSEFKDYLSTYLSQYFSHWNNFNPDVLCNIYLCSFVEDNPTSFSLIIDLCPKADLLTVPTYLSFGSAGSDVPYLHCGNFTNVIGGTVFGFTNSGNTVSLSNGFILDYFPLNYNTDHIYLNLIGIPFNLASSPSRVELINLNQMSSFIRGRFSKCLVSSFPFYYLNDSSFYFNNSRQLRYNGSPINDFIFLPLYDMAVYSTFEFAFPSPTPIPTALPTVSPTPLPLAYDSDIDKFSDGTVPGFLESLKGVYETIENTFSAIPFVSESIGYIYHYIPQFAFLWIIPLIAFLSFLLGRNKS